MTMPAFTSSRPTSLWNDRPVAVKVLTAVGIAGVAATGIGVMGIASTNTAADSAQGIYDNNVTSVVSIGIMIDDVQQIRLANRNALISTSVADTQAALDTLPTYVADYQKAQVAYTEFNMTPEKQALVDDAAAALEKAQSLAPQQGQFALNSDMAGWIAFNNANTKPLYTQTITDLTKLRDMEAADALASKEGAASAAASSRTRLIVLLVAGLLVALGVGWIVARTLARDVAKVKAVADALAAQDLTRTSGLTSRDELGLMGRALDGAVVELRSVMVSVVASSDAVAAASEELSASSAQISASAEETSVQSGVVSAAADEVSRNVATVAAGAEEMGASIREISQNANEAARVAAQAVAEAETTNATVVKLGDSSREIGNVVKVITSIAEQTNLLALNATIEAARAGEAGKGFAVVANEVKELAQATARATEDITRRVETIQGDTTGAVTAIGRISEIIGSINDFQLTIASAVEEQTATTNEMSRSVQEAAGGSTEIATNITGVSTAAASTTEALGQTRQAVDELSRMASDLRTTVSRFSY
jgi:methyl-accepting chemotaxis protein